MGQLKWIGRSINYYQNLASKGIFFHISCSDFVAIKFFEHKMKVTELRMLRWICWNTLMDRIRNQEFRNKLGVAPNSAKMRENRLRWFGHVQRKTFETPVRRIKSLIVEGKRSQGRHRRIWDEQIKGYVHMLHLSVDLTRDRGSWRRLIHALDYWYALHLLVGVLYGFYSFYYYYCCFLLLLFLLYFVYICIVSTFILCLRVTLGRYDASMRCYLQPHSVLDVTKTSLILSRVGGLFGLLPFMDMSCRRPSLPKPWP